MNNVLQFIELQISKEPPDRQQIFNNLVQDIFDYEHELDREACCHTAKDIKGGLCYNTVDEIEALQHLAELWR